MGTEETPIVPAPEAPAPRSFGDLFGESLNTYWDALAVFTGIAAVTLVPQALLSGALWAIGRHAAGEDQTGFTWNLLFPLGSVVFTLLAYPLMEGALIHATAERQAGRRIGVLGAYSAIIPKAGRLIGAQLLVGLLILLFMLLPLCLVLVASFGSLLSVGILLLIIVAPLACYFGVKWMLVLQQVVLDGPGLPDWHTGGRHPFGVVSGRVRHRDPGDRPRDLHRATVCSISHPAALRPPRQEGATCPPAD